MSARNGYTGPGTWVLLVALSLAQSASTARSETYTFESLTPNTFIHGNDNWKDQDGQGQAIIALDDTGNNTQVVRHFKTVVMDQSAFITRTNDATFGFVPFTGNETNAIIQFEANGEHLALFALGTDLNGDGILKSTDMELGPAFGVFDRKFRIQEANLGTAYDDGFNEGGGDGNNGNDWYRLQLRIDFTANGGDGSATLHFMNLTDQDTSFHTVSGLRNKPLGLSSLHPDAGPRRWNAMWMHLLSMGSRTPSADNLIPNLNGIRLGETTLSGSNLLVHWEGGTGPYQVQHCESLVTTNWINVGSATSSNSVLFPLSAPSDALRIVQP